MSTLTWVKVERAKFCGMRQEHMGPYYLALGCLCHIDEEEDVWQQRQCPPAHAHHMPLRAFSPLICPLPVDVRQLRWNHKAVSLICLCSLQAAQKQAKNRKKVCCSSPSALSFFPITHTVAGPREMVSSNSQLTPDGALLSVAALHPPVTSVSVLSLLPGCVEPWRRSCLHRWSGSVHVYAEDQSPRRRHTGRNRIAICQN